LKNTKFKGADPVFGDKKEELMNTALIFAGGTGQRMNARAKPKQFLELHGKPIIIYTLEHFEFHPEIDRILIVCLESWMSELQHRLNQYGFEKIFQVIPGGNGGHESIYKGLKALESVCKPDDIVLIHDGVRPLINEELISENIANAKISGAVITAEPASESLIYSQNGQHVDKVPHRSSMYVAKAPQTFQYGLIWELYQRAYSEGIPTVDSSHLCSLYDVEMQLVRSTPNNIKITTPADYYIFRALYEAMENQQILGL